LHEELLPGNRLAGRFLADAEAADLEGAPCRQPRHHRLGSIRSSSAATVLAQNAVWVSGMAQRLRASAVSSSIWKGSVSVAA
jgi:hypothetical protein